MTPYRVGSLCAAACFLTLAGVHDLEMIDIAIRLVEVAVGVVIVPIPHVERLELRAHLCQRLSRCELIRRPDGNGVTNEHPDRRTDVRAAGVRTVSRLVELHADPVDDGPIEPVPSRRLLLVVVEHPVEIHVVEMRPVEVGLPDGDVVDSAIGLCDLIVKRTWGAAEGTYRVAELGEDHEDPILPRLFELDILSLGDLLHATRAASRQPRLLRLLSQPALLLFEWVRDVVAQRAAPSPWLIVAILSRRDWPEQENTRYRQQNHTACHVVLRSEMRRT